MRWGGGASNWYSRRESLPSSDDEQSDYEEPQEVPLWAERNSARRSAPTRQPTALDGMAESSHVMSETTYNVVRDIFTPANEVKKKAGQLLLNSRGRGEYKLFTNIDLDDEMLEHAGHIALPATPLDRVQFAEKLEEASCPTRCGAECIGDCRVRAFVVTAGSGVDFYFGSPDDIVDAVLTRGAACDVYIWDELEHTTMPKLYRMLDSLLETVPGLAMRTTELRTVPGQVRLPIC